MQSYSYLLKKTSQVGGIIYISRDRLGGNSVKTNRGIAKEKEKKLWKGRKRKGNIYVEI
jgi:hypothetical protein